MFPSSSSTRTKLRKWLTRLKISFEELQKKALEKGEKVSLKELIVFEHSRTQNSLRIGIIALFVGLAIFGVGFMDFPATDEDPVHLIF